MLDIRTAVLLCAGLMLTFVPSSWARSCQVHGGTLAETRDYLSGPMTDRSASITVFVDKKHGGIFKLTTERAPDDPVGDYAFEAPVLALSCSDITSGIDKSGRRYIAIRCLKAAACVHAEWWGENVSNAHPPYTAKSIVFYFPVDAKTAAGLCKAFSHYLYLAQKDYRAAQAPSANPI